MKLKINVRDKATGKTVSVTKEIPAKDHLAAQIKYPGLVFKDKTKYTRKQKHKTAEK